MIVSDAIKRAEVVLPGSSAPDGSEDPRWQAIIAVSEFIDSDPDEVWLFALRWGQHSDPDLRAAIATCLLEHLLEYHFDRFFPQLERAVADSPLFADTFARCAKFGQSEIPSNAVRFDQLKEKCRLSQPIAAANRSPATGGGS